MHANCLKPSYEAHIPQPSENPIDLSENDFSDFETEEEIPNEEYTPPPPRYNLRSYAKKKTHAVKLI